MALTQTERLSGTIKEELVEFVKTSFHIEKHSNAVEKINTMSDDEILEAILHARGCNSISVYEIKKILRV